MSIGQLAGGRISPVARQVAKRDPLVHRRRGRDGRDRADGRARTAASPRTTPTSSTSGRSRVGRRIVHLMGTDDLGRDILSRVLAGGAASVFGPVVVVILSTVLGSTVAILSAWYGGWVDAVLTRITEVIFAIPGLVLAILAVSMFGKGLIAPVLALSIAYLPDRVAPRARGSARRARQALHGGAADPGCRLVRHLVPAPAARACCPRSSPSPRSASATRCSTWPPSRSSASAPSRPPSDWGVMISSGPAVAAERRPGAVAVPGTARRAHGARRSTSSARGSPRGRSVRDA